MIDSTRIVVVLRTFGGFWTIKLLLSVLAWIQRKIMRKIHCILQKSMNTPAGSFVNALTPTWSTPSPQFALRTSDESDSHLGDVGRVDRGALRVAH
jgi:hypothetical protein